MKKILYIEPNNNDKLYLYYTLLGKGLCEIKNINLTISDSLNKHNLNNYNLIILGYGACSKGNYTINKNIETKTPIIAFLFKLSIFKEEKFNFLKKNNIIIFGQQHRIKEFENKYNIKILPTLYPFDNSIFKYLNMEKIYDIGMTGALHNSEYYIKDAFLNSEKNIRIRIVNLLKKTKYKKYIKCSDKSYSCSKITNINEYVKTINQSKIWIATNADHGDLTPRYGEIIGCNTLLFCNQQSYDTFNDFLKDGETCVFFKNDLSDLIEKIDYYLNKPELCKKITKNAYNIFNNNFSYKNIVKKYLNYAK